MKGACVLRVRSAGNMNKIHPIPKSQTMPTTGKQINTVADSESESLTQTQTNNSYKAKYTVHRLQQQHSITPVSPIALRGKFLPTQLETTTLHLLSALARTRPAKANDGMQINIETVNETNDWRTSCWRGRENSLVGKNNATVYRKKANV